MNLNETHELWKSINREDVLEIAFYEKSAAKKDFGSFRGRKTFRACH
jgi:hypothetical protein